MEHFLPEYWALLHLGIVFSITLAQMMVVYALSDSRNPPAGLGLFTVYFMAALLGWITVTLQQAFDTRLMVDVPMVAGILNSYVLFLAAGQRASLHRGRIPLGALCLIACMLVFFLSPEQMFLVQAGTSALFFGIAGGIFLVRASKQRNVGDAIIAFAALVVFLGMPTAFYQALVQGEDQLARTIAFCLYSFAYLLVAVGFLASVLIEYQQHLSHVATQDPLTRLLNQRGLEEALHVTLMRAARAGSDTAAVMVEIDHFRDISDSFGQDTGDRVLQTIGSLLERISRAGDVVARIEGEKFLLILPDSDVNAAKVLAERIRSSVGEEPLQVDEQRIAVTVSLGVAGSHGEVSLDKLTTEAGRAIYLAKRGGHNRVAVVENRPVRHSTAIAEGGA